MATITQDHYLPDGLPAPVSSVDGLDDEYWAAANRGEIAVQKCNACGNFQATEWICHKCHSFDLGWQTVSPRGRIYSWERVWYPVHPALKDACPYMVVLVELPEADNVRVVGNLLGDPMQQVIIGSEVEAVFEDHGDYKLIQWQTV